MAEVRTEVYSKGGMRSVAVHSRNLGSIVPGECVKFIAEIRTQIGILKIALSRFCSVYHGRQHNRWRIFPQGGIIPNFLVGFAQI